MFLLVILLSLVMMGLDLTMGNQEVALQEFTNGNNLFTAAIYREMLKENSGNFLISPFSIQTVLALTQSGAKSETATEILSALHLPNATDEIFSTLLPSLTGNDKYALHTANKIYIKTGFPIREDFKVTAGKVYAAGIDSIEFTQKTEAADTINSWVETQTNQKIHDLIDPKTLGDDTRVILINALYFKGKWLNPFEFTRKRDFFKTPEDVLQVDTMHVTDLFNFYESPELNAKFLELPYLGDDISMVVVLPNEKQGLTELENQLEKVLAAPKFSQERVSVSLPRFTVENKVQLKKILENLGIKKAFTDDADLSGIAGKQGELAISDVVQKAFINVTKSGTEAAAATAASGVVLLSLPHEPKKFRANHPFLFYLKSSDCILFIGKYSAA